MDGTMTWDDQAGLVPVDEKPIKKLKKRSEKYADRVRFNVTNADRIRAMTDEELATKLYLFTCIHVFDSEVKCKDNGCKKCWLDWLRKVATDG